MAGEAQSITSTIRLYSPQCAFQSNSDSIEKKNLGLTGKLQNCATKIFLLSLSKKQQKKLFKGTAKANQSISSLTVLPSLSYNNKFHMQPFIMKSFSVSLFKICLQLAKN